MEKQVIHFKAGDVQQLTRTSPLHTFAIETINYIEARFDLPPSWLTFTKLYAVWYNDHGQQVGTLIGEDGAVIIPADLLKKPGKVYVNLCGNDLEAGRLVSRWTSYAETALQLIHTRV